MSSGTNELLKKLEANQRILISTQNAINYFRSLKIHTTTESLRASKYITKILSDNNELFEKHSQLTRENIVSALEKINNEICTIIKQYGTESIDNVLTVVFGESYRSRGVLKDVCGHSTKQLQTESCEYCGIYKCLTEYAKPVSYKLIKWRDNFDYSKVHDCFEMFQEITEEFNPILEDITVIETYGQLTCLPITHESFNVHINGTKVLFHDPYSRHSLVLYCIIDDVNPKFILNNRFIELKNVMINDFALKVQDNTQTHPDTPNTNDEDMYVNDDTMTLFENFCYTIRMREYLIYRNIDIISNDMEYMVLKGKTIKKRTISQTVNEFVNATAIKQRDILIALLIHSHEPEYHYLAYLVYDLLSNDANSKVDTEEQMVLYDSLPYDMKVMFRNAMKTTVNYTEEILYSREKKIPYEQQICLMNTDDSVKEKAMVKLKEVKSKSEDSGSKARHYLDGLLKIPFGIYKEEPLLKAVPQLCSMFQKSIKEIIPLLPEGLCDVLDIPLNKHTLSRYDVARGINKLSNEIVPHFKNKIMEEIKDKISKLRRKDVLECVTNINDFAKSRKKLLLNEVTPETTLKVRHSGRKLSVIRNDIMSLVDTISTTTYGNQLLEMLHSNAKTHTKIQRVLKYTQTKDQEIEDYISQIKKTLDTSVHGHENAKRQIERVIAQWMTGKNTGYCFGFEGAPGLGKTSLAKNGIAKCLVDENGVSRPFGFIAIGGTANGSTLEGHNYTYVGSTWGRICDILMESKCMNTIIFIDELDKVSRTEHGKEVIGILTHLVDSTQNDKWMDKYFNGIEIDLSKVLFIFSYNDPSLLDRILLDRVHRIKFDNLKDEEKIVIAQKYLLPEMYQRFGLQDTIVIPDDVILHIVNEYTNEPGVRKLKQFLYEIVSEVNLSILLNQEGMDESKVTVTIEDVEKRYLKDRQPMRVKTIHNEPRVGVINGLWANALGQGGIIPIQATTFPCTSMLDIKLTGMQGDVMKESMIVAKTLALRLTKEDKRKEFVYKCNDKPSLGIHIHTPEGAVKKDGPSAGGAITTVLYSLINNIPIPNDLAMTGETNLEGHITAIGGLDLKILGGIKAGVKTFLYPEENQVDFEKFMETYGEKDTVKGITFHKVNHMTDIIDIVFKS